MENTIEMSLQGITGKVEVVFYFDAPQKEGLYSPPVPADIEIVSVKDSKGREVKLTDKIEECIYSHILKTWKGAGVRMNATKKKKWTVWAQDNNKAMLVTSWNADKTHFCFYPASNSALEFTTKKTASDFVKKELLRKYSLPKGWKIFIKDPAGDYYDYEQMLIASYPKRKGLRTNSLPKVVIKKSTRKNPALGGIRDVDVNDPMYERRHQGLEKAKARKEYLQKMMKPVDRFQPSWALNNMVKALQIHPWNNTIEDWRRYYEAKMIINMRRARRK